MTSEKNFVPLIKQALTNIVENIEFKKTNSTALLSLRILSSAILALCRDAFSLLENNRIFTACSLVCQATEAQIQLLCIDKLYDTKGRDYYEFAFIEQLKSLPINPHWQEKTLQRMHYYNCERFYNGKGKNTADFNSYDKNWYRSFANSIKDLSKTSGDPLARILRRKLKDYGITHLSVCISDELPARVPQDEQGKNTPASIAFVPPSAGLVLAGEAVRRLLGRGA